MWVGLIQSGDSLKSQDWGFLKKEFPRQQQRYSAWVSACQAQPPWWLINTFIIAQGKAARQQLPCESSHMKFLAHTEIRQFTSLLHCTVHVVVPWVLPVFSDLPEVVSLLRHINSDFSASCGLTMGTRGKGGSPMASPPLPSALQEGLCISPGTLDFLALIMDLKAHTWPWQFFKAGQKCDPVTCNCTKARRTCF